MRRRRLQMAQGLQAAAPRPGAAATAEQHRRRPRRLGLAQGHGDRDIAGIFETLQPGAPYGTP